MQFADYDENFFEANGDLLYLPDEAHVEELGLNDGDLQNLTSRIGLDHHFFACVGMQVLAIAWHPIDQTKSTPSKYHS